MLIHILMLIGLDESNADLRIPRERLK